MVIGGMGFLGVKAVNWALMRAFFAETKKRASALAAHRQTLRPVFAKGGT